MLHVTCMKCKRRYEIDTDFASEELRKLKKDNLKFYQSRCPACGAVSKVPIGDWYNETEEAEEGSPQGEAE